MQPGHTRTVLPHPRRTSFQKSKIDQSSTVHALIDAAIVGLMVLAIMALLGLSSSMLTNLKVHYVTSGGIFLEKVHVATYCVFAAFFLCLIRHGRPINDLLSSLANARLTLVLFLCWIALFFQIVALKRPFTTIIDSFLLPPMICLVVWQLTEQQRRVLAWAFHAGILLNVVLGYYEYFSGHRLIPLTVGNIIVFGEWRSAALLGHPLTASGLIAAYVMALLVRPTILPTVIRLPVMAFCFVSLMVFGGRTALMTALVVMGFLVGWKSFRFALGGRMSLLGIIAAMCIASLLVGAAFAALSSGIFDKMLLRFSSDNGSAMARFATLNLLHYLDWTELILGADPDRITGLQSQLGLNYGIENFWISCVAQFGLVHTILMSIGLFCFFIDLTRRSDRGVWAIYLLMLMIAASSVSFSSKNIQLAQFIALITLLLPKQWRLIEGRPVRRSGPAPRLALAHATR
ncbi:VpsF family polysaccharide biosynthesis protein [Afipia felis]